jgi:hypothetical protein
MASSTVDPREPLLALARRDKGAAEMTRPVVNWQRATLVGAVAGGVFWGLAAGAILVSKASATAITAICVAAAVSIIVGTSMNRRSTSTPNRTFGIGLALAPLTGAAPVIAVWLPGLLTHAISWNG